MRAKSRSYSRELHRRTLILDILNANDITGALELRSHWGEAEHSDRWAQSGLAKCPKGKSDDQMFMSSNVFLFSCQILAPYIVAALVVLQLFKEISNFFLNSAFSVELSENYTLIQAVLS